MNTPYVARDPGPNPNISRVPPLRSFLILGTALVVVMIVGWLVLGSLAGLVARQVPDRFEARLGQLMNVQSLQDPEWEDSREALQVLVDELAQPLPKREFPYRVVVIDSPVANAAAVPGGTILVYSGLLEYAGSENEVAMVLAHELAHHVHRDHLESMGRRLVLAAMVNTVLGGSRGLNQLTSAGMEGLALKMGRDDERAADRLGLLLLNAHYGHVAGALDFFDRIGDQPGGRAASWFSTHPLSSDRVEDLVAEIEKNGYAVGETTPLQIPMP